MRTLRPGEDAPVVGASGDVLGRVMRSAHGSSNPIVVSTGHRVALPTAMAVVRRCCVHKIPEPIRLADLTSREMLRRQKLHS